MSRVEAFGAYGFVFRGFWGFGLRGCVREGPSPKQN